MFHYGIKLINKHLSHQYGSFILYTGKEKYKNIHIYQPFHFTKSYQFIGDYYVLAEHSEKELMYSNSIIGYVLLLNLWINNQKKSGDSRVQVLKRFMEFITLKNISKIELSKLFQFAEILVTLPEEQKEEYQEIKNQKINYMANIVVTPENELEVQETISYILSTRKTKTEILREGKIETAKNLKNQGVAVDIISQATGLSFNEINNL